ncbi:MAG: HAD family hydrolase [bacterium]|nr:HAD family hydrolase [bacterium]
MDRPLLILDLDETLIHATERPLAAVRPTFRAVLFLIHLRPHAREFLTAAARDWDLAIWTSASADYAEIVRGNLFVDVEVEFVWSRGRCTRVFDQERQREVWIKDLRKVKKCGRDLARVLVIDDKPGGLARSYGNLVRVQPWRGEPGDIELAALERHLESLVDEPDLRTVEKRGWRSRF